MPIVGVILARGGSKGIPRKNLQDFCGVSLVRRAAETAKRSRLDRVVVYSDDEEILLEGLRGGADPCHRPEEVAGDETSSEKTMIRLLADTSSLAGWDAMMIQCTTPFLRPQHIDEALAMFLDKSKAYDSVLSATALSRYLGYGSLGVWVPLYPRRWRRQDFSPMWYVENGAIYLAKRFVWESGRRIGKWCGIMSSMTWWESVEIDEPEDLMAARLLCKMFEKETKDPCQCT